jgi:hypothetical protein
MKYLSNREDFLKRSKLNNKYEKTPYSGENFRIYESDAYGAGPFHNDIGWNDSLIGRFINHLIRKAKVLIGRARMKFLTSRLEGIFDEIIMNNKMQSLTEDDKKMISKIKIHSFIASIKNGVDSNIKTVQLIGLTEEALKQIDEVEDFDNKDKIKKELEDFLEFLKSLPEESEGEFDDDENEEGQDESQEDAQGQKEQDKEKKSLDISRYYPTMIKNLKSLSLVLSNYKLDKKIPSEKFLIYVTKPGDTLKKIESSPNNKNKLTTKDIWAKNSQVKYKDKLIPFYQMTKPGTKDLVFKKDVERWNCELPEGIELKMEKIEYVFENSPVAGSNKVGSVNPVGSGSGSDRNAITKASTHATQAYEKIKVACQSLENSKDKGISITSDFLNSITSKYIDDGSKKAIISLYKEILRYLIGDKKETLNSSKDTL